MKQTKPFTAIVGADFIDSDGFRRFSFQICARHNGKFVAVALLNTHADDTGLSGAHFVSTESFPHSRRCVERLARIYLNRSIPQQFQTR